MNATAWLKTWLLRHPLKGPTDSDQSRYTAEVMAQVKAISQREPASSSVRLWISWPRLALTCAAAAAGIAIVLTISHHPAQRVAQGDLPDRSSAMIVLAESPSTDEAWVDETIQLLNEFNEDLPEDASGSSSDEWLDELQTLDENELAASS